MLYFPQRCGSQLFNVYEKQSKKNRLSNLESELILGHDQFIEYV